MPSVYRVYADERGDTHLTVLELPAVDDPGEGATRCVVCSAFPR